MSNIRDLLATEGAKRMETEVRWYFDRLLWKSAGLRITSDMSNGVRPIRSSPNRRDFALRGSTFVSQYFIPANPLSSESAVLKLTLWDVLFDEDGTPITKDTYEPIVTLEPAKHLLKSAEYKFSLADDGQACWFDGKSFFNSAELIDQWVNRLIKHVESA